MGFQRLELFFSSNTITCSTTFCKHFMSRSAGLVSSLSAMFIKCPPYSVVQSPRADRPVSKGETGFYLQKEALSDNHRSPQGPGRWSPPLRACVRHRIRVWWGPCRGWMTLRALGVSRSWTRPSSCSPAAFHVAILQFHPRWPDPSPSEVRGPAAGEWANLLGPGSPQGVCDAAG